MLPLQNFKDFITKNALFTQNSKVLLAVSGGRDSVLMVHLFKLAGYHFSIAHCNFNLRADESQRDEVFVKMLAATLEVPFHVTHFKTKDYAATHKISTQMAARDLRYQWFEQIRQEHDYSHIALAQHQDDAIETVLLNLTRGTGIAGLHGILPKRGYLVRPLLFLSRADIDRLVNDNRIDYVEDSSNLSANYARNKIRLQVLPHLKEINPNLEQTFEHNIKRFADTELVLQQTVASLKAKLFVEKQGALHLSVADVKNLLPQKLLLFELLRPYGFSEFVVDELLQALDKQSGTSFYSQSHRIIIDRQNLILTPIKTGDHDNLFVHAHDQLVILPNGHLEISPSDTPYFENEPNKAFVDLEKLIYPLVIRKRQQGDKFMPMGMKTFKKLSDFLIDQKVPLTEKDEIPILINGNGEVVWVAGLRQDDRYKITASTKRIVIFKLKQ